MSFDLLELPSSLAFEPLYDLLAGHRRSTAPIVEAVEQGDIPSARRMVDEALLGDPGDPLMLSWKERLAPPIVSTGRAERVDLSRESAWLIANASNYRGRWVAIVGTTLVASDPELKGLLRKLKECADAGTPLVQWVA